MLTREEQIKRAQQARVPKAKPPAKGISPISDKKAAQIKEQKKAGESDAVYQFFVEMRPTMTGKCLFCGGPTEKKNDDTFHFSLAHLLGKANFNSVATNPDNIIELCHFGESCHTNFDHGTITWQFLYDSAEWPIIKDKLLRVLPAVAPQERSQKLYGKLWEMVYGKTNKEI